MAVIDFKFYNREEELKTIEHIKEPYVVVVIGRRRVGKTTYILELVKNKDFIYFFVNPEMGEELLLQEFEEIIKMKIPTEEFVSLNTWEKLFRYLFEKYKGIVIFDEFQWFKNINPAVPYILQKYLDTYSLRRRPSFIISGSIIGMMKELYQEKNAPLFKRNDKVIHLRPFNTTTVLSLLKDTGIESLKERMRIYLTFGGLPYYYKLMKKYNIKNLKDAIWHLVIEEFAPLQNEVEDVLLEAFKGRYLTYLKILHAIGTGHTKLSQIASFTSIPITSLPPYLYDLEHHLEIIRRYPLGFTKKHYYEIEDFFHLFWFRFLFKKQNELIVNRYSVYEKILNEINSFHGITFEKNIRHWFEKKYSFTCKYVFKSRETGKILDIDILSIDKKAKSLIAVEVKWQDLKLRDVKSIINELHEKLPYVQWENDKRKEILGIFAKKVEKKAREWLLANSYKVWDLGNLDDIKENKILKNMIDSQQN